MLEFIQLYIIKEHSRSATSSETIFTTARFVYSAAAQTLILIKLLLSQKFGTADPVVDKQKIKNI